MGYVYKIINCVNNKVYIGITKYKNPKNRFYKHVAEYTSSGNYSKRPLYEAMKKYGVNNFVFEVIEEISDNLLGQRESYWINYYRSFIGFKDSNGYNATLGGDGGHLLLSIDKESEILNAYKAGCSINQIMKKFHHTGRTVKLCLEKYNIEIRHRKNKQIAQMDSNFNIIKIFNSICDANEYFGRDRYSSKINEVCNGKRKTAYGYYWKYV